MGARYRRTTGGVYAPVNRIFATKSTKFLKRDLTMDAHPKNIIANPYKGQFHSSFGYLRHPDVYRFGLISHHAHIPCRPGKNPYEKPKPKPKIESFREFKTRNFGGMKVKEGKTCNMAYMNLKQCFKTQSTLTNNPGEACSYYFDSLNRFSCI